MLDDAGLRREQIAGAFGRDPQLSRGEIDDASEAADIVGALHLKSPERDIGKVGVEGSLWMARQDWASPEIRKIGAPEASVATVISEA